MRPQPIVDTGARLFPVETQIPRLLFSGDLKGKKPGKGPEERCCNVETRVDLTGPYKLMPGRLDSGQWSCVSCSCVRTTVPTNLVFQEMT